MKKYFLARLVQLVPILFGITFLTFGMMQFTEDDAVDKIFEQSGSVAEEIKAAKRAELGLDQPFIVQYGNWLGGVLTGDMGRSFISGKLVFETFAEKLPATVELMLVSILLTIFIATPLGILAAVNQNRPLDYLIRGLSFIGNSIPVKNYDRFQYFERGGPDTVAILRPEFISIFKKGESVQYSKSAEEGTVEDIIFRGSNLEIRVRLHDNLLSAIRSINDPDIRVGETVDVFIHRLFVIDGETVTMEYNQSLRRESVII